MDAPITNDPTMPAATPDGIPSRDDAPFVQRLCLEVARDRCGGGSYAYASSDDEGDYVEHDEHQSALAFEVDRSDALEDLVRRQAAEIAMLRSLQVFSVPVLLEEKESA